MSLIETQDREQWLARGSNRSEWQRLASACALADGFAFFAVQVEDAIAAGYVAELLAERADALPICNIELRPDTSVAELLEQMRSAARPCLFWLAGEDTGPEFASFFALLNQKREVVSALSEGPFVLALHPLAWTHFRQAAPDFWSIHQAVFRFTAARRMAVEPIVRVRSASRGLTPKSPHASSWRISEASLAKLPTQFGEHETELRWLVAALHEPGAKVLVAGVAGSGKTTLVAAALPAIAKRHPGGIFRVPVDDVPGSIEERASAILMTLLNLELRFRVRGRPTQAAPLDALRRQFVHATAGRAALFWFEDVEAPELLEWLLPGPESSLVVTSRGLLVPSHLEFTQVIRLGPDMAGEARVSAPVGLVEPRSEELLDNDVDESERALAMQRLGELALERGDLPSAHKWFERTLELDEALGEPPYALVLLAQLDRVRGDLEAALDKLARAYPEFRTTYTDPIDEELRACHDAASPELRARLCAIWEAAGHEWPFDDDSDAD